MPKKSKAQELLAKGVVIPDPKQVYLENDLVADRIEPGVILQPGVVLRGKKTLLGQGSTLGPGGNFENIRTGRQVKLSDGYYANSVFFNGAKVRGGAEIRDGCLFMECAQAAHTVGCKMTVLGIKVVLGSLINFCDVFVSGGNDEPFGFTEIGSGAIHYNFTPNGLKFGSLIGPGALGEMFGLSPRTFIGGQTQIIAPNQIGSQVLVPAGLAVRTPIADGLLCVQPYLNPMEKSYEPAQLVHVKQKFLLTANLLSHYQVLAYYFTQIRQKFARHFQDSFLECLYREAEEMIRLNREERLAWLFSKQEESQRVDLCAKLPQSLKIYQQKLPQASPKEQQFIRQQIQEHELICQNQEHLARIFAEPLPCLDIENHLIKLWEQSWQNDPAGDYLAWMQRLPTESKLQGRAWLAQLVKLKLDRLTSALSNDSAPAPIIVESKPQPDKFAPCHARLLELAKHDKFLVSGNFRDKRLGVLNWPSAAGEDGTDSFGPIFSYVPDAVATELLQQVLDAIGSLPHPALIQWSDLWSWIIASSLHTAGSSSNAGAAQVPAILTEMVKRGCIRFHGTDGLRGRMVYSGQSPADLGASLQQFIYQQEVSPELFAALARNTIYAFQLLGNKLRSVIIGRDTRDLYADHPSLANLFYRAVREGALSTGCHIEDAGIVPVPGIPYMMAYLGSSLAIYKSASHNPASQDGLKVFVRYTDKGAKDAYFGKASASLEGAISALLVKEALSQPVVEAKGKSKAIDKTTAQVFANTVSSRLSTLSVHKSACLVADLAHGAFAAPAYRDTVTNSLQKISPQSFLLVGDRPTGKNINNNDGNDRVGAAHLENVQEILPQDLVSGGTFGGFPGLKALYDFGLAHRLNWPEDKFAWAIFTDGDGDRGYGAFYHPYDDAIKIIDGEKAFFYQILKAVGRGEIKKGQTLAFTVECSVPFINAVISCLSQVSGVQFVIPEQTGASQDKINLKIVPVGDKYLLRQRCPGMESSGHVIQEYQVTKKSGKTMSLYAGNGILAMLDMIESVESLVKESDLPFAIHGDFHQKLDYLARPYPTPYNVYVYIYFISRKMWYRSSAVWGMVEKLIRDCCDCPLTPVLFPEEPDTLYLVSFTESRQLRFAILARLSGTENKMSIKLFGEESSQAFFPGLSERLFAQIAPKLKNFQLPACQDEIKILQNLLEHEQQGVPVSELVADKNPEEKAYFMMIVEAVSQKGEKLATYDGTVLKINERGKQFLALQRNRYERK